MRIRRFFPLEEEDVGLNVEDDGVEEGVEEGGGRAGSGPSSSAGAMPARQRKLVNWCTIESLATRGNQLSE